MLGQGESHWTEVESHTERDADGNERTVSRTVTYGRSLNYVDLRLIVAPSGSVTNGSRLTFPFTFSLPQGLPPTFTLDLSNKISYRVVASVRLGSMVLKNPSQFAMFDMLGEAYPYDLNGLEPKRTNEHEDLYSQCWLVGCCFCLPCFLAGCGQKQVNLTRGMCCFSVNSCVPFSFFNSAVEINRPIFLPGQQVIVSVKIRSPWSDFSAQLTAMRVALVKKLVQRDTGPSTKVNMQELSVANLTLDMATAALHIPMTEIPTFKGTDSDPITWEHLVLVTITLKLPSANLCCPLEKSFLQTIPITIVSVPSAVPIADDVIASPVMVQAQVVQSMVMDRAVQKSPSAPLSTENEFFAKNSPSAPLINLDG